MEAHFYQQLRPILKLLDDDNAAIQEQLRQTILKQALPIILQKDILRKYLDKSEAKTFENFLTKIHSKLVFRAFQDLLAASMDDVDLESGALIIAYWYDPNASSASQRLHLDHLAEEIAEVLPHRAAPIDLLGHISNYLFARKFFRGNAMDYYNPENTMLNRVLETGMGIPISLSVLYMLIAKRLQVPVFGVTMPGHFILKYDDANEEIFFDPFNRGRVFSRSHCLDLLAQLNMQKPEKILEGCSNVDILRRMLNNLYIIFTSHSESAEKAAEVKQYLDLFKAFRT